MTVAELMAELQKYPVTAMVRLGHTQGWDSYPAEFVRADEAYPNAVTLT